MSIARRAISVQCVAVVALWTAACPGPSVEGEITRERAIEIARSQVSFDPDRIDAERDSAAGRAVWRVTLRGRLPGQPPGLFETAIVEVDRRTGEIVTIART